MTDEKFWNIISNRRYFLNDLERYKWSPYDEYLLKLAYDVSKLDNVDSSMFVHKLHFKFHDLLKKPIIEAFAIYNLASDIRVKDNNYELILPSPGNTKDEFYGNWFFNKFVKFRSYVIASGEATFNSIINNPISILMFQEKGHGSYLNNFNFDYPILLLEPFIEAYKEYKIYNRGSFEHYFETGYYLDKSFRYGSFVEVFSEISTNLKDYTKFQTNMEFKSLNIFEPWEKDLILSRNEFIRRNEENQ